MNLKLSLSLVLYNLNKVLRKVDADWGDGMNGTKNPFIFQ